jgi:hypothetical protein
LLYREIIAVCCDNGGSTNAFCGYNVELRSVKAAGVRNVQELGRISATVIESLVFLILFCLAM